MASKLENKSSFLSTPSFSDKNMRPRNSEETVQNGRGESKSRKKDFRPMLFPSHQLFSVKSSLLVLAAVVFFCFAF